MSIQTTRLAIFKDHSGVGANMSTQNLFGSTRMLPLKRYNAVVLKLAIHIMNLLYYTAKKSLFSFLVKHFYQISFLNAYDTISPAKS